MKSVTFDYDAAVPNKEKVDMKKGTVLLTERFGVSTYGIYTEVPASTFFKFTNFRVAILTAGKISDLLVACFDTDVGPEHAKQFGVTDGIRRIQDEGCLYVFKTEDGRYIHQHST